MTTAAESMPLSEYLTSMGVEPSQAAQLGAQGDALSGRAGSEARATAMFNANNIVPTPEPVRPVDKTSAMLGAEALRQHEEQQLAGHLDQVYAPPASATDYVVPSTDAEPTDEAVASNIAFTRMLHAEGMPLHLGNAVMADAGRDFMAGKARLIEHPAADVAALKPWVAQLLSRASADPEHRAIASALTPEMMISALSRETVIALRGFVDFRARH